MHIPSKTLSEADIIPFAQALAVQETADVPYDRDAWLYIPHKYEEYRYILGTRGVNPLICIGINPSTAAPGDLDNTLKSVERIAHGNGYDSFIMFNVYAQRATDPNHMEKICNNDLHRENMKAFDTILAQAASGGSAPHVWAAWGTIIKKRPYLPLCVRDMITVGARYGASWFTCGARSKVGGHPHHPLYLRKDAVLDPFDPEKYCREILGAM